MDDVVLTGIIKKQKPEDHFAPLSKKCCTQEGHIAIMHRRQPKNTTLLHCMEIRNI
jgi:hypothetical protein